MPILGTSAINPQWVSIFILLPESDIISQFTT